MDNIIYDSDWNLKQQQQQLNEPLQEPVPFEGNFFIYRLYIFYF
jgi:hypothetical protein